MKTVIKRALAVLLALSLSVGIFVFPVGAAAEEEVILNVTEEEIESYGFRSAVQSALNEAKQNATAQLPYTVIF